MPGLFKFFIEFPSKVSHILQIIEILATLGAHREQRGVKNDNMIKTSRAKVKK